MIRGNKESFGLLHPNKWFERYGWNTSVASYRRRCSAFAEAFQLDWRLEANRAIAQNNDSIDVKDQDTIVSRRLVFKRRIGFIEIIVQ